MHSSIIWQQLVKSGHFVNSPTKVKFTGVESEAVWVGGIKRDLKLYLLLLTFCLSSITS